MIGVAQALEAIQRKTREAVERKERFESVSLSIGEGLVNVRSLSPNAFGAALRFLQSRGFTSHGVVLCLGNLPGSKESPIVHKMNIPEKNMDENQLKALQAEVNQAVKNRNTEKLEAVPQLVGE